MNQGKPNNSLTAREKDLIKSEFNSGGYVLNFSNNTFASFTIDSVGESIQDKYGLSKGASLECFFDDADDQSCAKLLNDLIQKRHDMELFEDVAIDSKEEKRLAECQKIADRLVALPDVLTPHRVIMECSDFNTKYIEQQVKQMYESIDGNPTDAIGKAKELLESCAKTILKECEVDYSDSSDFSELMKSVYKELNLHRDCVPDDKKASQTIKNTLSSISTIVSGVNDLRNSYGSGHGKENDYEGLSRRHARLVVGVASSATTFLWDTHKAKQTAESQSQPLGL